MRGTNKVQVLSELTERAECSVSGSMSWMLRMSQLVGVAPVRFHGRRVSVSLTLGYIHFVIMTVLNAMAMTALVNDLSVDFDQSIRVRTYAQRILWTMDLSAVMIIASVAAYGAPSRISEVLKCLCRIQEIKKDIKCTQSSICLERKKRAILVSFLVLSTSCVVYDCQKYMLGVLRDGKDVVTFILYFGYEASYILVFVVEMQFLLITLEVYETFNGLNDALGRVSRPISVQSFVVNQCQTKTIAETIRHLALAFNNLYTVMKRLEKAFGSSLILLLLSCLLHMIIKNNHTIFLLISIELKYTKIAAEMSWCAVHFLRTVLITEPSHFTQVQLDRTYRLVSQLILQNNDRLVSEELDKFYRYIQLNKMTYTPMGMCTLNRPLLASIMSSVVAYLVIAIQFQILELSGKYEYKF